MKKFILLSLFVFSLLAYGQNQVIRRSGNSVISGSSTAVSTTSTNPRGFISAQHSSDTNGAQINFRKSRGTEALPTTIVTGDTLSKLTSWAYDGSSYIDTAGIEVFSSGTIAANRVPSEIRFYSSTDAAPSVKTLRLTLAANGNIATQTGITMGGGDLNVAAGSAIIWASRGSISYSADGVVRLLNAGGTDFNRLQLGGTTTSFPSIKRSGAAIHLRLADDSNYTDLILAAVNATTGVTAGNFFQLTGRRIDSPSGLQTLAAGTAITIAAPTIRIVSGGGVVVMTTTPTIADGGNDGQTLRIFGTSDVNTVTLQDEAVLPGSNLQLGAATRVMGLGDILVIYFDNTSSMWYEQSFANN